jgi:hypothetical protein
VKLTTHLHLVPKSSLLPLPRVEAGKNTSTVIPASRKRRRKGNSVVSGDVRGYGKGTELVSGDVRGDGKGTQ